MCGDCFFVVNPRYDVCYVVVARMATATSFARLRDRNSSSWLADSRIDLTCYRSSDPVCTRINADRRERGVFSTAKIFDDKSQHS